MVPRYMSCVRLKFTDRNGLVGLDGAEFDGGAVRLIAHDPNACHADAFLCRRSRPPFQVVEQERRRAYRLPEVAIGGQPPPVLGVDALILPAGLQY